MTKKKLNIALDYDDTITADPNGFKAIVRCFQSLGHKVTIVTLRDSSESTDLIREFLEKYDVETIFCAGQSKERIVRELGLHMNIWVDDNPRYITNDYPNYAEIFMTKPDLNKEGPYKQKRPPKELT